MQTRIHSKSKMGGLLLPLGEHHLRSLCLKIGGYRRKEVLLPSFCRRHMTNLNVIVFVLVPSIWATHQEHFPFCPILLCFFFTFLFCSLSLTFFGGFLNFFTCFLMPYEEIFNDCCPV